MSSPHCLQAVCRPLCSKQARAPAGHHILFFVLGRAPLFGPWLVTGAIISILFPTLWIRQQQDLDYMHAGGFRFYRSCLSDVRRRQWRKTGEWRLTCRIRRLRQPPREVSPVSGGSVSSPPSSSSPPTQNLQCDSQEYKPSSDMLRKDLGMGFLPTSSRPPPVVCAAGPRCLRSLPVGWHV